MLGKAYTSKFCRKHYDPNMLSILKIGFAHPVRPIWEKIIELEWLVKLDQLSGWRDLRHCKLLPGSDELPKRLFVLGLLQIPHERSDHTRQNPKTNWAPRIPHCQHLFFHAPTALFWLRWNKTSQKDLLSAVICIVANRQKLILAPYLQMNSLTGNERSGRVYLRRLADLDAHTPTRRRCRHSGKWKGKRRGCSTENI